VALITQRWYKKKKKKKERERKEKKRKKERAKGKDYLIPNLAGLEKLALFKGRQQKLLSMGCVWKRFSILLVYKYSFYQNYDNLYVPFFLGKTKKNIKLIWIIWSLRTLVLLLRLSLPLPLALVCSNPFNHWSKKTTAETLRFQNFSLVCCMGAGEEREKWKMGEGSMDKHKRPKWMRKGSYMSLFKCKKVSTWTLFYWVCAFSCNLKKGSHSHLSISNS